MFARIAAFVVWALVAASVVFWGLRLLVRPPGAPAHTVAVGDAGALRGDLTRLLGATPATPSDVPQAPELASRFKLLGVMANKQGSGGYALIAVDAKPARAYAVGMPLDGNLVLQSVNLRSAAIGPAQGAAAVTLEVPPLAAAATGTLPPATEGLKFGADAAPPPPPQPAAPMALPGQALSGAVDGSQPQTPRPRGRPPAGTAH
ncbi:type II secretion system protein N [Piscinibacter sp.]|uniref:type II secretion system protein N n=1 Tax=Piscinibacter sp. TaxID=1903157 RepID=UPI0039E56D57